MDQQTVTVSLPAELLREVRRMAVDRGVFCRGLSRSSWWMTVRSGSGIAPSDPTSAGRASARDPGTHPLESRGAP